MESIIMAILGGVLIGLSASALFYFSGRIAGISGIVAGLMESPKNGNWRLSFVGGLIMGGLILSEFFPTAFEAPSGRSLMVIAMAGALVGFGTRLGNGCTSGHGVCGLTRFSRRSLVATLTFMATGFVTATIMGLLTGGPS